METLSLADFLALNKWVTSWRSVYDVQKQKCQKWSQYMSLGANSRLIHGYMGTRNHTLWFIYVCVCACVQYVYSSVHHQWADTHIRVFYCELTCASTSAQLIPRVTSVNEAWWELGVNRSADRHISFQCQTPSLSVLETLFSHASALSLPIHQIPFFSPQLIHLPPPRLLKAPSRLPHYAQITSLPPPPLGWSYFYHQPPVRA